MMIFNLYAENLALPAKKEMEDSSNILNEAIQAQTSAISNANNELIKARSQIIKIKNVLAMNLDKKIDLAEKENRKAIAAKAEPEVTQRTQQLISFTRTRKKKLLSEVRKIEDIITDFTKNSRIIDFIHRQGTPTSNG